jgi:hypothetical protein
MGAQDFRSAKALFVPLLKRDIVLAVARHDPGGRMAIPRWTARIHLTISGAMAAWPLSGVRAAVCGTGHCAALVAIDRNSWSRFIGMSARDCRDAQLFSGIDFTKN